jgi:hypothetical protein
MDLQQQVETKGAKGPCGLLSLAAYGKQDCYLTDLNPQGVAKIDFTFADDGCMIVTDPPNFMEAFPKYTFMSWVISEIRSLFRE